MTPFLLLHVGYGLSCARTIARTGNFCDGAADARSLDKAPSVGLTRNDYIILLAPLFFFLLFSSRSRVSAPFQPLHRAPSTRGWRSKLTHGAAEATHQAHGAEAGHLQVVALAVAADEEEEPGEVPEVERQGLEEEEEEVAVVLEEKVERAAEGRQLQCCPPLWAPCTR